MDGLSESSATGKLRNLLVSAVEIERPMTRAIGAFTEVSAPIVDQRSD
jgi:hypothetical protein